MELYTIKASQTLRLGMSFSVNVKSIFAYTNDTHYWFQMENTVMFLWSKPQIH